MERCVYWRNQPRTNVQPSYHGTRLGNNTFPAGGASAARKECAMRNHRSRWMLGGMRLVGMLAIGVMLSNPAFTAAHGVPPITTEPHGWVELGEGMDGDVTAVAVGADGSIYVGGKFTAVGTMAATNIARWNPRRGWESLGDGVSHPLPTESYVLTMAVHPNGDLYVGGWFGSAGGIAASNVARWTPRRGWEAIGSGPMLIEDRVTRLLIGQDGNLYVRGSFAAIGGVTADNIARWDQTTWHALGDGGLAPWGPMLMTDDGVLHVASLAHTRTWNGVAWGYGTFVVGPSFQPMILAMIKDPTGARGMNGRYLGGNFTHIDNVPANSIARGTSARWVGLGTGVQGTINDLALGKDGMLYATGNFALDGDDSRPRIARWNGTTWNDLGLITSCAGPIGIGADGKLYTIGCRPLATGVRGSFLVRWDTASN